MTPKKIIHNFLELGETSSYNSKRSLDNISLEKMNKKIYMKNNVKFNIILTKEQDRQKKVK